MYMLRTCCAVIAGPRRLAPVFGILLIFAVRVSSALDPPKDDNVAAQLAALASGFEEPLISTRPTSRSEDEALLHAICSYRAQEVADDFRGFETFPADYPRSGWRVAVLTN